MDIGLCDLWDLDKADRDIGGVHIIRQRREAIIGPLREDIAGVYGPTVVVVVSKVFTTITSSSGSSSSSSSSSRSRNGRTITVTSSSSDDVRPSLVFPKSLAIYPSIYPQGRQMGSLDLSLRVQWLAVDPFISTTRLSRKVASIPSVSTGI